MNRRPPCMDDMEWTRWDELNRLCRVTGAFASPCTDCMPDFAADMREQGLCDSRPGSAASLADADRRETIQTLHRRGYSQAAIAAAIGISRSSVRSVLHKRTTNASERRSATARERRQAIVTLSLVGMRTVDIARQVGVSESYVRRHRVRAA